MKNNLLATIRDSLLVTLIVYTLIVSWNNGGMFAFFSIILLGVILGLLTLVYDVESLERDKQIGIHIGGSILAILIVALINQWLIIDWSKVFTGLIILVIIAILGYVAYMYYLNRKNNPKPILEDEEDPFNEADSFTLDSENADTVAYPASNDLTDDEFTDVYDEEDVIREDNLSDDFSYSSEDQPAELPVDDFNNEEDMVATDNIPEEDFDNEVNFEDSESNNEFDQVEQSTYTYPEEDKLSEE